MSRKTELKKVERKTELYLIEEKGGIKLAERKEKVVIFPRNFLLGGKILPNVMIMVNG